MDSKQAQLDKLLAVGTLKYDAYVQMINVDKVNIDTRMASNQYLMGKTCENEHKIKSSTILRTASNLDKPSAPVHRAWCGPCICACASGGVKYTEQADHSDPWKYNSGLFPMKTKVCGWCPCAGCHRVFTNSNVWIDATQRGVDIMIQRCNWELTQSELKLHTVPSEFMLYVCKNPSTCSDGYDTLGFWSEHRRDISTHIDSLKTVEGMLTDNRGDPVPNLEFIAIDGRDKKQLYTLLKKAFRRGDCNMSDYDTWLNGVRDVNRIKSNAIIQP